FIQYHSSLFFLFLFFFFLAPPTTAIYTLSLHDALPISAVLRGHGAGAREVFRRRDGDGRRQHHPQEPDVAAAKSRRLGAQDRRRNEDRRRPFRVPRVMRRFAAVVLYAIACAKPEASKPQTSLIETPVADTAERMSMCDIAR